MKRILLIDGDVVAFIAASAVQHTYEDDFGYVQPFANTIEGKAVVDNIIFDITQKLESKDIRVFLSDDVNYRKTIDPEYKANRKDSVRPLLLSRLREYLKTDYEAETWAGLEADDTLAILATEPMWSAQEERIIVGRDKDTLGVPCKYFKLRDPDAVVVETDVESANRFHLAQTLAGDHVDNYKGCDGIGFTRAERIIADPVVLKPSTGVVTRGVNKGQKVVKWTAEPTSDLWACVVSHYLKAGMTENDALRNARLAYILRWEDYDTASGKINLWTPEKLKLKPTTEGTTDAP